MECKFFSLLYLLFFVIENALQRLQNMQASSSYCRSSAILHQANSSVILHPDNSSAILHPANSSAMLHTIEETKK